MSAIADDPAAELRALRERAYGPDADINGDPAAMQRLRELEDGERIRPASSASPDIDVRRGRDEDEPRTPRRVERAGIVADSADATSAADAAGPAHPEVPSEAPVTDNATAGVPADDGVAAAASAPAQPWWRQRMRLLWAASLVAAALLGAAVALSVHAIGAGQVAVLSQNPDSTWPEGFFSPQPEGGATFEDFHGLTPVRVPQQMGPEGTISDCLYVLVSPSSGMLGAGCSAGTFPATAAILVTEQSRAEVLERFQPGTALQFVLDGSEVRVYAAAPVPSATP